MFCGIIGFVHSDDSFRIGVWLLNSTTESSLWILFLLLQLHFTIRRKDEIISRRRGDISDDAVDFDY